MTTFDDTDFFTDAFTGFRDEDSSRRPRLRTGLALVAAAALVAGGLVAVRLAQDAPVAAPADPLSTLAAFGHSQRPIDLVDDEDLAGSLISPSSTRLLATAAGTRYF